MTVRGSWWGMALAAAFLAAGCSGAHKPLGQRVLEVEGEAPDVRREAVLAIAASGQTRRVPKLVELVCAVARSDPDAMVRAAAAQGLGRLEGEKVIDTLMDLLAHDSSPYVRADAAAALGQHAAPEALPALAEALEADASLDVRIASAEALAEHKSAQASDALVRGLRDADIALARRCWEGLRYMTGQDLPRDPAAWKDFLASAPDPFAQHGRPPRPPAGVNQRPRMLQGLGGFFRNLVKEDPLEAELK